MPCRFTPPPRTGEGAGGVQAEAAGPVSQRGSRRAPDTRRTRAAALGVLTASALGGLLLTATSCAVDRAPAIRSSPDLGVEDGAETQEVGGSVDGGSPDADMSVPAEPPRVERVDIAELPDMPLARALNVLTAEPVTLATTVSCVDGDGEDLTGVFVGDTIAMPYGEAYFYEEIIVGLAVGAQCDVTIEVTSEQGVTMALSDGFDAPAPRGFPDLDLLTSTNARQPGWTLFDLIERRTGHGWIVLLDERDRVRWITRTNSGYEDLHVTSLGVLRTGGVTQWAGGDPFALTRVHEADLHAVEPSPFHEGAWFQIIVDDTCGGQAYLVETRGSERLGTFCPTDWFEAPPEGGDWTHLNGFDFFGTSGQLVLSFRDLQGGSLVGVHWPTQRPLWIAVGGDVFGEQHAPEVQPNGNIVLFDNTYEEASSAVEIALTIDPVRSVATATEVWRFADPRGRHQGMFGDADRQPNGNTLITFGAPVGDAEPVLLEVTPAGEIAFELQGPAGWTTYRAERFTCPNSPSLGPWECPSLEPPKVLP